MTAAQQGAATVTFTATDAAATAAAQRLRSRSKTRRLQPSTWLRDATVECDGAGTADPTHGQQRWRQRFDACSGVTWSNDFDALSDDCGNGRSYSDLRHGRLG